MTGKSCEKVPVLSPEVQDYSSFTFCVLRISDKEKWTTTLKTTTTPKIVTTSEGTNHAIKSRHDPFLEMLLFIIFSYILLNDYM